jgi:hypothetical protein
VGAGHPPEFGIAQGIAARRPTDVHLLPSDHRGLALLLRRPQTFRLPALTSHGLGPSAFLTRACHGLLLLLT